MMDSGITIWENFRFYLPYISLAFLLVFIITPLVGKLAQLIGAIDLPAHLRQRTDRTKEQRLHTSPKMRLGGLGVVVIFLILVFAFGELTPQIKGILVGVFILSIGGFIDDKFELSGQVQILFQLVAAIIAVVAGVTIEQISFAGANISLVAAQSEVIRIAGLEFIFRFPADVITVIWIVALMNALNWMCGIDALGESISIVAAFTVGFISIKLGHPEVTLVSFVLAGSILGFLPYNFPPSKILGGTIGEINYGYLLATLSILSGAKMPVTVLLLVIPIADMVYVLISRVVKYKVINPIKLLSISGRIHLHHRLMDMGLSDKVTLYLEISFFLVFAVLAFYFADFRFDLIIAFAVVAILLFIFLLGAVITRRIQKIRRERPKPPVARIVKDLPPEERYKY